MKSLYRYERQDTTGNRKKSIQYSETNKQKKKHLNLYNFIASMSS